jgi:hypothetical protein
VGKKKKPAEKKKFEEYDVTQTTDRGTREITVTASVKDMALAMRQELATATTDDGISVELAAAMSGHVLITIKPPSPAKGWRTYALSPRALVAAVLAAEGLDQ